MSKRSSLLSLWARALAAEVLDRALTCWLGPWAKLPDGYGEETIYVPPKPLPAPPALSPIDEEPLLVCPQCEAHCASHVTQVSIFVACPRCDYWRAIERYPVVFIGTGRGIKEAS